MPFQKVGRYRQYYSLVSCFFTLFIPMQMQQGSSLIQFCVFSCSLEYFYLG